VHPRDDRVDDAKRCGRADALVGDAVARAHDAAAAHGIAVVARSGMLERPTFGQAQIHVEPGIQLLDPLVIARRQIDRFHASREYALPQFGKGFGLFYEGLGGFGFAGQSIRPLSWAVGAP